LEIPFALTALYESQEFDAMVAIGCVIRGETYHFELVSNESARGITDLGLREAISIANVVLTVENEDQARARIAEKGRDGARVALEMGNLRRRCIPAVYPESEE
jgi:6,7-dimethyl-8-ribityllumazine synthase